MGVGGQRQAPTALPSGKTRYLLHRRLGGPQSWSGWMREISPPTGIQTLDCPARSESLCRLILESFMCYNLDFTFHICSVCMCVCVCLFQILIISLFFPPVLFYFIFYFVGGQV
jgi:hypothetical protein